MDIKLAIKLWFQYIFAGMTENNTINKNIKNIHSFLEFITLFFKLVLYPKIISQINDIYIYILDVDSLSGRKKEIVESKNIAIGSDLF